MELAAEEAGLAEMEQHIQQEAPGFFSEPPVSEIPAQQIKKLKARCRQEARTFWYDWRAKLESATTNSLKPWLNSAAKSAATNVCRHCKPLPSREKTARCHSSRKKLRVCAAYAAPNSATNACVLPSLAY